MSKKNKREFKVEYQKDGKTQEVVCVIKDPTIPEMNEADKIYRSTYNRALREKDAILRIQLVDLLRAQNLWNDEKEAQVKTLRRHLSDGEMSLSKGGIPLSQMREICLNMRQWRNELAELMTVQNNVDRITVDSQAEDARFDYYVTTCTYYKESGERVWKTIEEYKQSAIPEIAIQAAIRLSTLQHGIDENFEESLLENRRLKEYGFVDDQLRLINKDGHLVDLEGRLIDEFGNFVDKDGNRVDIDGNRIDDDGNLIVEMSPFLDDDGNPVPIPIPSSAPQEEEQKQADEKEEEKNEEVTDG
jgi:hypothetical protein